MVLMNGPKRVRNVQSLTNQTKNYGIMGGLVSTVGRLPSNQAAIRNKAANNITIPTPGLGPAGPVSFDGGATFVPVPVNSGTEARAYMMGQNPTGRYLMSRNPACSGGVGRRPVFVCNLGRSNGLPMGL